MFSCTLLIVTAEVYFCTLQRNAIDCDVFYAFK